MKREAGQVYRLEISVHDQFHDRPTHGHRMLQSMSAESVGKDKVDVAGVVPDDQVLVNVVVVVVTCPPALHLEAEKWKNRVKFGKAATLLSYTR